MSKCDNCGKEAEVKNYVIKDELGTRYRNLCTECAAQVTEKSVGTHGEKGDQADNHHDSSNGMVMSKLYRAVAILLAGLGFVSGLIVGSAFSDILLTLYIWIGTAFTFLIYWGIGCILKNQEAILAKMK